MFHNHNHKDWAVSLEIISVNMSCNCQISPLERPNPTEAYSLPQCWGFSSKEIQEAIWPQSRTMEHKAECAVGFTCKSAFGAPPPPRVFPQLFPFHAVPFHSQSSYYHRHVPLMLILTLARVYLVLLQQRDWEERANITFTLLNASVPRTHNVKCVISALGSRWCYSLFQWCHYESRNQ